MPMTKGEKVVAKVKTARVRDLLSKTNLFITDGDAPRAFQAAEEAYMAAFDAKAYLDRVMMEQQKPAPHPDDPHFYSKMLSRS